MLPLRKIGHGKDATSSVINVLIDRINVLSKVTGRNGIKVTTGLTGIHLSGDNSREAQTRYARRAKIQAGGVGTTTLTCKLIDGNGNEIGSTLAVHPVEHLGSNDLNGDVWPDLAAGDYVPVFQDLNGSWYTTFVFDDTADCT